MNATLFEELEVMDAGPKGIRLTPDFLTLEQEAALVGWIDSQPWMTDLSRRRQFYGGTYGGSDEVPMPKEILRLAVRLYREEVVKHFTDRCLINEYLPGQGIGAHVDYTQYGDEVVMLSLCDTYPMRFEHVVSGESHELWLPQRSACVLSGESRYEWTHEIAKRKADFIPGGGRKLRRRRLSITFRRSLV